MNKETLYKEVARLNKEIYHLTSKWFVVDCRLLTKGEKKRIKKVGNYITPCGVEIAFTDGSLISIPHQPSPAPYDTNNPRIVFLRKMGKATIVRIAFSDVPIEVEDFSEIENNCKALREEKQKLIEAAASEGIEISPLYKLEWY